MAYEMLIGDPPFVGGTPQEVYQAIVRKPMNSVRLYPRTQHTHTDIFPHAHHTHTHLPRARAQPAPVCRAADPSLCALAHR